MTEEGHEIFVSKPEVVTRIFEKVDEPTTGLPGLFARRLRGLQALDPNVMATLPQDQRRLVEKARYSTFMDMRAMGLEVIARNILASPAPTTRGPENSVS